MTVLTIIGILVGLYLIYLLTQKINGFTRSYYNYELFEIGSAAIVSIGYYCLFFGYGMYQEALVDGGDLLNGIVLVAIGAILILLIVLYNIRQINIIFGLPLSIIQLVIYAGVALGVLIVLFLAFLAVAGRNNNYYYSDRY